MFNRSVWFGLFSLALSAGCGQDHPDNRPVYRPPGDGAEVATLTGYKGWYIDDVDGSKVEHGVGGPSLFGPSGGNEVTVAPGKHHVTAVFYGGGQVGNGSGDVEQAFEAGHRYQFRSHNLFDAQTLRVIDLTAKANAAAAARAARAQEQLP